MVCFTYYLLGGLKGKADLDEDGLISVSEIFTHLSRTVPQASKFNQHPVKKGVTEWELMIDRAKRFFLILT